MGGEDSDPDKNLAEGYIDNVVLFPDTGKRKTRARRVLESIGTGVVVFGKIAAKEVLGVVAAVELLSEGWDYLKQKLKRKDKRSHTAKKLFPDD